MSQVRYGIIGIRQIGGSGYASILTSGKINGAALTAVCDEFESKREWAKEQLATCCRVRERGRDDRFRSVDGVIRARRITIIRTSDRRFCQGLHVLVEKPAGVYTKQVREMNDAAAASGKIYGIMYNQRTNPLYVRS